MAGQIAELAHRTLQARLPRASTPARPASSCVDAAAAGAAAVRREARRADQAELEKLGVEVLLGAMVTDVDERGIEVEAQGRPRRADRSPSPRSGRPACRPARWARRSPSRPAPRSTAPAGSSVNPDLTLPGPPRGVRGRRHDRPRPPARASRRSRSRARSTPPRRSTRRLEGKPPQEPFKYFDKGSMATIIAASGRSRWSASCG